ncbi:MAG: hypothetical protein A2W25_15950 [candidate division Zixibacteria bacterium RBG_16_53_22]|nr:MAG: hypothetical protein A2W25_15950 [candidate division Zixibacteria bacterium RBG_16_53_22]
MMELAARTAPKTRGDDFIMVKILRGEILKRLADSMVDFGQQKGKGNFDRDGANVAAPQALVLIGLKDAATAGLNCGACGFSSCQELEAASKVDIEFAGPLCSYRHLDLGIALGSAARTAQLFNVDNRIMYRVGAAARHMGLVDWEFVMGIPLSASGKNIFFDR